MLVLLDRKRLESPLPHMAATLVMAVITSHVQMSVAIASIDSNPRHRGAKEPDENDWA